jgi:hypothetical protein
MASRVFLAVAVILVGLSARFWTAGWFIFFLGPVYFIVAVVHIAFHSRIARDAPHDRGVWTLIMTSHAVLLVALLLQYDMGDGLGWLTILALVTRGAGYPEAQPPAWLPISESNALPYDLVLFVPVVLSYLAIKRVLRRTRGKGSE